MEMVAARFTPPRTVAPDLIRGKAAFRAGAISQEFAGERPPPTPKIPHPVPRPCTFCAPHP